MNGTLRTSAASLVFWLCPVLLQATSGPHDPPLPDSIHHLQVAAEAYSDEPAVWLLNEVILRMERDGGSTRTHRLVVQVLRTAATASWAEQLIGYDPAREELALEHARVFSLDGTLLCAEPVVVRDEAAPGARYAPRRQLRVVLSGVAPNTIVDIRYRLTVSNPTIPGDVALRWQAVTAAPVRRARLVLDVPRDLHPHVVAVPGDVMESGDRRVHTWQLDDLPRTASQPFAPAPASRVAISGAQDWRDVGAWYAALIRGSFRATPALRSTLAATAVSARTRLDSLRAAHRFVAQDVRYADVAYEMHGYLARPPDSVLVSMSGDCKDRVTLFIAFARMLGYEAHPVLVSSTGELEPEAPSAASLDHVLATVRVGREWRYLDLTAPLAPFDADAVLAHGGYGLRVHEDGTSVLVRFAPMRAAENRSHVHISGKLAEDGAFAGRFQREVSGLFEEQLRSLLAEPAAAQQHAAFARDLAAETMRNGIADSLQLFPGRDLDADARVRLWLHAEHLAQGGGRQRLMALPLASFGAASVLAELERAGTRTQPIDAAQVYGPREITVELTLELPAGWRAQLPPDVHAESAFGSYRATYQQWGSRLHVKRSLSGAQGVVPASAAHGLVEWLQRIAADDVAWMVLTVQ